LYHKYLAMMPSASYHPRVVLELRNKGGWRFIMQALNAGEKLP
jgi:hypothetical protein